MRSLYSGLVRLAAPLACLAALWRGFEEPGYWLGLGERFGAGATLTSAPLWLHAVSLGEMSAAAPLIRSLLSRHPSVPLLLTTATPAGRARARDLVGATAEIRYLPYDTPGAVRRFLHRTRPRAGVIMETELWPNLFAGCAALAIPLLIANARLSPRSVERYARFGGLFGPLLAGPVTIAAQSADDAQRFRSIGARDEQLHVVGNLKFDIGVSDGARQSGRQLRELLGAGRPVWVAGSTHKGEDEAVLAAHARLRERHPEALLLLAPRHKDRFAAVASLLRDQDMPFILRSSATAPGAEHAVLLVDTLGELVRLYAAADVAFVGGSLVPIGGHNLLEPAALGLAVLTGPSVSNGKEVAALLVESGAARVVVDARALAETLLHLVEHPAERAAMGAAALSIVAANQGSVERLGALIEPWAAERPATAR